VCFDHGAILAQSRSLDAALPFAVSKPFLCGFANGGARCHRSRKGSATSIREKCVQRCLSGLLRVEAGEWGARLNPCRTESLLHLLPARHAVLHIPLRATFPLDAKHMARDSVGTLELRWSYASYAAPPGVTAPRGPLRCRVDVYQSVSPRVSRGRQRADLWVGSLGLSRCCSVRSVLAPRLRRSRRSVQWIPSRLRGTRSPHRRTDPPACHWYR
jgi:hypothetical protein